MNRQVSPALASVFASRFANWKALGEGGEGAVFAVWDRNRKIDVALKVMRDTGEADLGERFEREYGILAASRSNHLVTVHDYGQEQVPAAGGEPVVHYWYTMERCESSARSVYRGMPLAERVGVALAVLDGLAFLHAKGIAHRDIKPDNVFLVKGQAKLGDFGLARASQAAGGANGRGLLMGSPPYLSPERWSGEPIGDERPSDQYAAGVMIYELLSAGGAPLAYGTTLESHCRAHAGGRVNALYVPEMGARRLWSVDEVLGRMMSKLPEARYADIAGCKRELSAALVQEGVEGAEG